MDGNLAPFEYRADTAQQIYRQLAREGKREAVAEDGKSGGRSVAGNCREILPPDSAFTVPRPTCPFLSLPPSLSLAPSVCALSLEGAGDQKLSAVAFISR